MESKFSHLRRRDTSVSMLRVKMSRRKSQTLKENRDRAVNSRRQLDKLPELEASSLDASIAMANMSTIVEKTQSNAKSVKGKTSTSTPVMFVGGFFCFFGRYCDGGTLVLILLFYLFRFSFRREDKTAGGMEKK